ncbi:DUF4860 domain-containing protein [Blautia sp. HCP3S3_H10_1]|uniref:DUF4860 domain-containing protein n=1 Tax=unclassified Blautia TaxID=2648079 RepID=UPI003F8EE5D8|nr:DUF4860 domain-containing protein [Clostridia bacterium]
MSTFFSRKHSVDSLATLLLFAMYVLFLLFLLLFGAGNYQASVKSLDTNNNLYTAASYITTKFRQHDQEGCTSLTQIQDTTTLCFQENMNGKPYFTYIYFDGGHLKELFTAANSQADLSMGTELAQLQDFQIESIEDQFYRITLTDIDGHSSSFLLHPGVPV